ncbi:MAG: recombinase family protein [Candidatus Aenigmarchaeota archaeon]|nr:recombinase family protein [Candidatus Aenigmarchaeota archaeon]
MAKKSETQKPNKSGHRIAFYVRVSTEEQAENPEGSIRNQEERLKAAVQLKNMEGLFGEVVETFIDRAKSGKDTNRSELQRLLSAIRRREVTLLMVTELSRLSRSIKDFAGIWELMQANGCGFMSLRENFDTTTAAGEMVLYTVANIAQFERRQISERVSANLHARAARGLYNGGTVPMGYKLIPGKKGYLEIEPEQAEVVKKAFEKYLQTGSLVGTAKWLNANGYQPKRETQGGGDKPRTGLFNLVNLHDLLCRKAYIGVKVYKSKGEVKEAQALWEPIIDKASFFRAQTMLKEKRQRKPESERRYPYALTGFIVCEKCGERMAGKSANGNGGKIPYYEHTWQLKRQSGLVKKCFDCSPFRILAKKVEPAIWTEAIRVMASPELAKGLIEAARQAYTKRTQTTETRRVREKISALKSQLEVMAERLSQLPKTVSAEPIFRQMEKIEILKNEEEKRLVRVQTENFYAEKPASLNTYQDFLADLKRLAADPTAKTKVLETLIHKIRITPEGFKLEFFAGEDSIERGLARVAGPRPSNLGHLSRHSKIGLVAGSTELTNGDPGRTRSLRLLASGSKAA